MSLFFVLLTLSRLSFIHGQTQDLLQLQDGCVEVNVNYGGNDIPEGVSTQSTWQQCQTHCGTNTECTHWTFRESDGNCWLKTANDVKTMENDLVSGPRDCPGTDCSCSDFITQSGKGQCQKGSKKFGGALFCYVNLPSTCTDKLESGTYAGKWYSAQACTNTPGRQNILCSCSDFITKSGKGQCKRGSKKFGGAKFCYVNSPSTCTDRLESRTYGGKWYSAQACRSTPGCGENAKKAQKNRIVGGRPADPDEWPWLAALVFPAGRGSGQYCGATLISDNHVLTAAHCLAPFEANQIKVRLGEYDFNQDGETGDATFSVASMKMHENYNDVTYDHDIAIIKLDRSVIFSKSIWPICLPQPAETFDRRRAFVIGWGTIYFGGPTSSTLQEVNVRVWDQETCKNNYNKLNKKVTDDMLCAGEQFKDSCQGDSGGPLNCQNPETKKWELCGVVSWGAKCAEPEFPGVYTRVTNYLDWIRNNSV